MDSVHPLHNPHEAMRLREMGEVAYNLEKRHMALEYIGDDPEEAARLTGLHFVRFWFPRGRTPAYTAVLWIFALVALSGYLLLWREHKELAVHCGALLASFPLVYYVVSWSSRYRDPMEWVLVLLAAVSITFAGNGVCRLAGSRKPALRSSD